MICELAQTLDADAGVDHLFEARLGRRAANPHRDGGIGDRLVHEREHPRSRHSHFFDDLFINFRLLVLQRVDERVSIRVARRRLREHRRRRPRLFILVKMPSHLRLPPAHGILQHVVIFHHPLHALAVDFQIKRLERAVVRQPVQLLRLHDDAVAIKQKRESRVLRVRSRVRARRRRASRRLRRLLRRRRPRAAFNARRRRHRRHRQRIRPSYR